MPNQKLGVPVAGLKVTGRSAGAQRAAFTRAAGQRAQICQNAWL